MISKNWEEKRVLLAEDEETNIILMREFLSSTRLRIDIVRNGQDAVDKIESGEKYDLILMDIKMPRMNGLEAMAIIKKQYPTMRIIAQSAYALAEEREQAMETGCDDYITKPIRRDDLILLMSKYLG